MNECRTDTRRIDEDNSLVHEFRADLDFHTLDVEPVVWIVDFGNIPFEDARDLTFDRGQKWFFAVLESDPGGCSRAGLDERRNGGDRRNTGRQQGRPQKRVEQRALPAFELTQHCDAKQALVEPRPQ